MVGFVASFYFFVDRLMEWITGPIVARGIQVVYTTVSEAFTTKLKVALVTGIILAFPAIVWLFWRFIRPALYPRERRVFRLFFFLALILFAVGIFVFAAILTPPDVVSQVMLGVPMVLLYEVGILVSRMVKPAERA